MCHVAAKEYHNVFLSPHFIPLTRYRMAEVDKEEDRDLLLRLVKYAQDLVLQLQEVRGAAAYDDLPSQDIDHSSR